MECSTLEEEAITRASLPSSPAHCPTVKPSHDKIAATRHQLFGDMRRLVVMMTNQHALTKMLPSEAFMAAVRAYQNHLCRFPYYLALAP
jgi:hypothetical protein